MAAMTSTVSSFWEELLYAASGIGWRARGLVEQVQFRALWVVPFGASWEDRAVEQPFDYHPPPPHPTPRGFDNPGASRPTPSAVSAFAPHAGRAASRPIPAKSPAQSRRRWWLAATAATVTAPWWGLALYAHVMLGETSARYEAAQRDAQPLELVDGAGQPLGLLPRAGRAEKTLTTLPSADVPVEFFAILRALENPDSPWPHRNWYGVDFWSASVGLGCSIIRPIWDPEMSCRGGSTLEMQGARAFSGGYGGKANGSYLIQLGYMADASAISLMFERDSPAYRAFVVDGLTFGTAPGGAELYGLRRAALASYGEEPDFASQPRPVRLARWATLVAMLKHRIAWSCQPGWQPNRDQVDVRGRIRDRAIDGLVAAFPNDADATAAIALLKREGIPMSPAAASDSVALGLPPREACLAAGDMFRSAKLRASNEAIYLNQEVKAAADTSNAAVTAIRLTTSSSDEAGYKANIGEVVGQLNIAQQSNRFLPLGEQDGADILTVRTQNGAITGLYTTSQRRMLDEPRRTGSIGKLIILVAAVRAGFPLEQGLCQARDRRSGLREVNDFGGFDDCGPGHRKDIRTAFGKSLNLPILWLGRQLDEASLREVAATAGFKLPANVEPSFALVTGMSEASPRNILGLVDAIARGAANRPAIAPVPYIVHSVRIDGKWVDTQHRWIDLRPYVTGPKSADMLRQAAGGALSVPGATLAGAVEPQAPLRDGEVAKSGTVAGSRPRLDTMAKLAVGGWAGEFSWFVTIGAPSGFVGDREFSMRSVTAAVRSAAVGSEGVAAEGNSVERSTERRSPR